MSNTGNPSNSTSNATSNPTSKAASPTAPFKTSLISFPGDKIFAQRDNQYTANSHAIEILHIFSFFIVTAAIFSVSSKFLRQIFFKTSAASLDPAEAAAENLHHFPHKDQANSTKSAAEKSKSAKSS